MRRLFTAADSGLSESALRWGEHRGNWRRLDRAVYGEGPEPPNELDRQRARVLAAGGVASGALTCVLLGLDGVVLDDHPVRRRAPDRLVEIAGVRCVEPLQALIDLAGTVSDDAWEQALESALRRRLVRIERIHAELPSLGATRTPGTTRIRRVLAVRPPGAPPTESLLETLMIQLARTVSGLGEPTRQLEVFDEAGSLVARLDLSWPDIGFFVELDGQQHKDQPVYDARRETAVVATTGWLPGRFTWHEVTRIPRLTARRLGAIAEQAGRR